MDNKPMKSCLLKVLVFRDDSIPDQWVAHCLDLDLVAQGDSISGSLEALKESVQLVGDDDLLNNVDPLDRPTAPEEMWQKFFDVIRGGTQLPLSETLQQQISSLVCVLQVTREHHPVIDGEPHQFEEIEIAEAWQLAQFSTMRSNDPCVLN